MIQSTFLRFTFSLLLLVLGALSALATHNRAGEIRIEQTSNPGQVRATVVTYTAVLGNSQMADRDSLVVFWGDGSSTIVVRQNGPLSGGIPSGEPIDNNIQRNVYVALHTYSNNRGTYTVQMGDINRIADIRNIDDSVNQEFFIETTFTFLDPTFQGPNSTPLLLQPPIDNGCIGKRFIHNPNAFDPDGDSLAYRLGVPLGTLGVPLASYRFPSEFGSAVGPSSFRINEITGTLIWDAPRQTGNYNAVILIISYREGIAIDTTLRDMQIFITDCLNLPPAIQVNNDFCLIAGDEITLNPVATAPISEPDQQVLLEVTSATFDLDVSPATWTGNGIYNDQPYQATYNWQTACEHVDKYPYKVIFKATDDFGERGGETNLSWLEVVQVKVSAPPPLDLQIDAGDDLIDLTWEAPYACENARDSFFYGFSVWRREGTQPIPFDSCRQGLDGQGYTRITRRTRTVENGRYVFADDDIERGRTYCYRILAQFVRYTQAGRPFNLVESIPSMEVCIQSSRDLPLLTRVDVLETSTTSGQIDVRWTPPLAEDLDTLANPPPYVYTVLRSPGVGTSNFAPVAGTQQTYNSFAALQQDTQYIDTGLNTVDQGYTYAIEFMSNGSDNGIAPLPSSSVYLNIASSDEINVLSWDVESSWEDTLFYVLRETAAGFDTLARTDARTYSDTDVVNGVESCYRITGLGSYGVSTINSEIINNSQLACGTPLDTIPPCTPSVSVRTICDDLENSSFDPPYPTTISWEFLDCQPADDLVAIRVYELVDSAGTARNLLGELPYPGPSELDIENEFEVANCYAVTAVDSVGNESRLSPSVCVTNCPLYIIPNVITPNGDGTHDVLQPRRSRFVESVAFRLYNRWGNLVFETADPMLNWDATTLGGKEVSQGTYFYTCDIFERLVNGEVVRVGTEPLEGFVEVLR